MHILYPRVATTTGSPLLDSVGADSKTGTTIKKLTLNSANRVVAFQKDYASYLWGDGDSSGDGVDLTSSRALAQITKFVKPMILKKNNQSGVTLMLSGSQLSDAQISELDSLMQTYSNVASQSSMFIYQHSRIDTKKSARMIHNEAPITSGSAIMTALVRSGVVSRVYESGVKKLRDSTIDGGFYKPDPSKDLGNTDRNNRDDSRIYIKLYPRAVQFNPPRTASSMHPLSHARLLQVTRGRTNPSLILTDNLAFNTYDTQWLDIYTSFFDTWYSFGNPPVDIVIGDYVFKDMVLQSVPRLTNNHKDVETFSIVYTSENTELSDIVK